MTSHMHAGVWASGEGRLDAGSDAPLLSVVVPIYNAEAYLPECLDSIARQATGNFEVILVDDGSTDGSRAVAQLFAARGDVRVRLVEQENRGPYAARMAGVGVALGAYVLFCDADDAYAPGWLGRIGDVLTTSGWDVLVFETADMAKDGRPCLYRGLHGCVYEGEAKRGLIEEASLGFAHNSLCNKAIRRELLRDLDPVHPALFGEDLYVVLQVYDAANSIGFIGDRLYRYRDTAGSITHVKRPIPADDIELLQALSAKMLDRWGLGAQTAEALGEKSCWYCAKVVESILGSGVPKARQRELFADLRARAFTEQALTYLQGSSPASRGLMRRDLAAYVRLLGKNRFAALRGLYALQELPKRVYRGIKGGASR